MKKSILISVLTLTFITASTPIFIKAENTIPPRRFHHHHEEKKIPITVKLDGIQVDFDQEPIVEDGITLVPFRTILETMGVSVEWDEKTKRIICKKDQKTIILTIGSKIMTMNGKTITLEKEPKIINKRTLIPLRAVSECFDTEVEWDSDTKTIEITTLKTDPSEIHQETTKAKSENVSELSELHNIINQITKNRNKLNNDASSEFVTLLNQINAYERTVKNYGNITDTKKLKEIKTQYKSYIQKLKIFASKNGIILPS